MSAQNYMAPENIGRVQQGALLVGILGLTACAFGAFISPDQFLRSYLLAYLLALGVTLGSLGLVMLQHMTGGDWGILIRRPLESATRTLPLLAISSCPFFWECAASIMRGSNRRKERFPNFKRDISRFPAMSRARCFISPSG